MHERNIRRVERLPRHPIRRAAVEIIAQERMTQVRHVHANLMRAPREKTQPQHVKILPGRHDFIRRHRPFPVLAHLPRHRTSVHPTDGRLDPPRLLLHMPGDKRDVMPRDQIVTFRQLVLHLGRLGDHDQPRRVSIQPINRMNAASFLLFRKISGHRIHQRFLRTSVRRMNHHPRRLVDDEQPFVLVNDGERQRNRHDIRLLAPRANDAIPGRQHHLRIMHGDAIHRDRPAPLDPFPKRSRKSALPPHEISKLHRRMPRPQAPLPLHKLLL